MHASNVIFAFVCLFVHNSLGSNTVNSLKFKTESQQSLAKKEQLVTAGKGFPACTRPSVHQAVCPSGAGGPSGGGGRAENQPWLW